MTSQNGPQFFPNMSDSVIINPRITYVGGNAYFGSGERHGSRLLLDNISAGAFHDAAERGDPPKCHPHTRIAIRTEIMEWIKAPKAMRKLVIWMYGPAGSGKTAIAQSVAEECQKEGLLAASFFFGRTAAGRNDTSRVVATLSYQLARTIPEIQEHIISAIEEDPAIFSRTFATQMQVLVVAPLKSVASSPRPTFVILDSVDEAGPNAQAQVDLLNIVGTAISELKHIPLIFLIASRPEYEIREAFNGNLLASLARSLVLDASYMPDNDIRLYFNSKFQEICDKNLSLGSHLPSPWPVESDMNHLVEKASGQFIFAATVTKFIDSLRHHPAERLDIILGLSAPGNETPFALLDTLYHSILSSVVDVPRVLEILTVVILATDYTLPFNLTIPVVEELLGVEVRRALVDMHALVFVPPPDDDESGLRIHHASLYDFLTDRSRSHGHCINTRRGHIMLSRRWLKLATKHQIHAKPSFSVILRAFAYHCGKSPVSNDIVNELASFNLKQRLEDIYKARCLSGVDWSNFFECVQRQAGERADVLPRLQNDFDVFILERISKYPPAFQTCIPAILTLSEVEDVFHFFLCGTSVAEIAQNLATDSRLLDLGNTGGIYHKFFYNLFQDKVRAREYFVEDQSYAVLAQQIVKCICPKPEEATYQINFDGSYGLARYSYDGSDPTRREFLHYYPTFDWFAEILSKAPINLKLARSLHECTLQYDSEAEPIPGREKIATASLEYIQRCGILYLNHAHLPDTDVCIICSTCDGASVIESDPLDDMLQSHSPPSISEPLSYTDDSVAEDQLPNDEDESHIIIHFRPFKRRGLLSRPPIRGMRSTRKRVAQSQPGEFRSSTRLKTENVQGIDISSSDQ